jgi:hypothetical protein
MAQMVADYEGYQSALIRVISGKVISSVCSSKISVRISAYSRPLAVQRFVFGGDQRSND